MLIMLALLVALAVLAPVLGSDSRDGLDWAPDNFWMRRRRSGTPRSRRSDSPGRPGGGRGAADGHRTIPAAG